MFLIPYDALQDNTDELDLKIKKYLRGEGANLEVWSVELTGTEKLVLDYIVS